MEVHLEMRLVGRNPTYICENNEKREEENMIKYKTYDVITAQRYIRYVYIDFVNKIL